MEWYVIESCIPLKVVLGSGNSHIGNSNYAAITAIFAANAILVAYIITSLWEDRSSMQAAEQKKLQFSESRKDQ